MKLFVPNTTIKSKFLRTLQVGVIFKDPINEFSYRVEERPLNGTLLKTAVPYLGEELPIEVNVPDDLIKQQVVVRNNPITKMKERITFLECQVEELLEKLAEESPSNMYSQLEKMMGDEKYRI